MEKECCWEAECCCCDKDCCDICANVVGRLKEEAGVAAAEVELTPAVELGRGRRVDAPEWFES